MKRAFFLYFLFGLLCFPSLAAVKKESAVAKSIRLLNQNILTQKASEEEEQLEMRDRNLKAESDCCFPNRAQQSGEAHGWSQQQIAAFLNEEKGREKRVIEPSSGAGSLKGSD